MWRYLETEQQKDGGGSYSNDAAENGNGVNLDLFQAIRMTLTRGGVDEKNIVDTGICTHCSRDYFSFRRNGETGRQAALLWMI